MTGQGRLLGAGHALARLTQWRVFGGRGSGGGWFGNERVWGPPAQVPKGNAFTCFCLKRGVPFSRKKNRWCDASLTSSCSASRQGSAVIQCRRLCSITFVKSSTSPTTGQWSDTTQPGGGACRLKRCTFCSEVKGKAVSGTREGRRGGRGGVGVAGIGRALCRLHAVSMALTDSR